MEVKKKFLKYISEFEKHPDLKKYLHELKTLKVAINAFEENSSDEISPLTLNPEWRGFKDTAFLFTDGACRGNPGPGAYAFVLQNSEEEVLFTESLFYKMTTNNQMEMSAVIFGLKKVIDLKFSKVFISSDSKYVIDGISNWIHGWKARGWKKADKKEPENLSLWKELDELVQKFSTIKFFWIKGHAGHPQNELCDKLANEAMDEALL